MPIDKKKLKNRIFIALRIIISVGILFFLFKTQFNNFKEVASAFGNSDVNYWFISLSFIMNLAVLYLIVLRWNLLLRTQKISASQSFLLGSYLVGCFFNNFLPTSIGGDVYRIHDTSRIENSSVAKAATIIFMDRFTGLISSIIYLMAAISLGFLRSFNTGFMIKNWKISSNAFTVFIILLFIIVILVIFMMLFPDFFKLNKLFKKIKFLHKWENKFRQIFDTLKGFRKFKLILFINIMLSFILQLAFTLIYYFAGLGFGINKLSLITFIFITQISIILTMLPISIGGVGVREGTFIVLVGFFGGPKDIATIVSLVVLVIILLPGIAGGIIYAIRPAIDKKRASKLVI